MGALFVVTLASFGLLFAPRRVPVRVASRARLVLGLAVPLLVATSASAAVPQATLTARVDELNELCADTWCSGDFDYVFTSLRCTGASSCVLGFEATDPQQRAFESEVMVSGFKALMDLPKKPFRYEGSFEEAVSNALASWEKHPAGTAPAPAPVAASLPSDDALLARVDELNELCSDTWCSGSFDYVFEDLHCASATACVLRFEASDDQERSFTSQVTLGGFKALEQDESKGFTFQGSFEEAVSNALASWEKHPNGAAPVVAAKVKAAPAKNPLVARVDELNELCAETWCSGSFEYHFSTLTCATAKSCTLAFVASDEQQQTFTSTVALTGFSALSREPFIYEGSFEEAVSVALEAWEQHPGNGAPVVLATKSVKALPPPVKPVAAVLKPVPVKPAPMVKVAQPMAVAAKPAVKTAAFVPVPAPAPALKAPVKAAPVSTVSATPAAHRSSKNLQD